MEYPSRGSETQPDLEVLQVGMTIRPGSGLNKDIARLLKLDSVPDFCRDDSLSVAALDDQGHQAYILPTEDGKSVCVFDYHGEVAVTVPVKTDAHAAAVALHFVLEKVYAPA